MNTTIVRTDPQGRQFNSDGMQVIACKKRCGRQTTMTGTELCDLCWEAERRLPKQGMTPTRAQYQKAAALLPDEIDIHHDGVWAWDKATKRYSRPWQPLTPQDGLPLLAKVERWLDSSQCVVVPAGLEFIVRNYIGARASGNEAAWLEAGFLLSVAIQEAA